MLSLAPIRAWLGDPRELERGVLMRRTGITLNLAGGIYALLYAALFATPEGVTRIAASGVALAAVGITLWRLSPRAEYATISALVATGIIGVILTARDVTATVPLFYLWPMVALAYFHSPRFLAGSLVWMAATIVPGLLIDGTVETHVIYLGAVSTTALMAALVAVMRHDEQRLRRYLLQGSSTDALTGLLNRRAFVPAYEKLLADARDRGDGVSVVFIDLDHFKRFNDTHGHLAGDAALRRVAAVLQAGTEPGDLVARLGGEEFAVVLPGRGPAAAQRYCDRVACTIGPTLEATPTDPWTRAGIRAGLRAQLEALIPDHSLDDTGEPVLAGDTGPLAPVHGAPTADATADGTDSAAYGPPRAGSTTGPASTPAPPLSASFGIVHQPPRDDADADTLLARADDALYAAKRSGRDRVAIYAEGRSILGPPMHVGGVLTTGATEPIDQAGDGIVSAATDPRTILGRRARVLFKAASAMYVAGSLNAVAGVLMLDMSPSAETAQWVIAGVLAVLGLGFGIRRGSLRHAALIGWIGIAAVSAVVATVEPLISAPLFYAWPMAMTAYFARPIATAWTIAWTALTLIVALMISDQPVNEVGMVVGTLLNTSMLAALISALRWREDRLSEGLERAAAVDPLTGALTRRAFLPTVESWLAAGRPGVSLLLVDVDHFKRYNDRHGHLAGDAALRRAADALSAAVPEGALVCRFGGEEFAIALPTGGMAVARDCADHIAEQLAGRSGDLTISAGIAVAHTGELAVEPLVARADQGLYAAKGAGRARVAWFAADSDEQLVVAEPIRVARPPAFEVLTQAREGEGEGRLDLSSAA